MEIIKILEEFTRFLEQSLWFKAFRFGLGLYLIIMIVAIVLILFRLVRKFAYVTTLLSGQEFEHLKLGVFQSRWNKVVSLIEGESEAGWKAAVLESSSMLNEVLETIGYEGETLGQKLASILPEQLGELDKIKKANDAKNEIVKNESYKLSKEEAEKLVETFGDALRFFEAIN